MMAQKIITGCATRHFLHGLFSEGGKPGHDDDGDIDENRRPQP
jgi:hypothetical protein